jgi:hypothetical protein
VAEEEEEEAGISLGRNFLCIKEEEWEVFLYKHCLPKTGEHGRFDLYPNMLLYFHLFLLFDFSIVAVHGNVHIKTFIFLGLCLA